MRDLERAGRRREPESSGGKEGPAQHTAVPGLPTVAQVMLCQAAGPTLHGGVVPAGLLLFGHSQGAEQRLHVFLQGLEVPHTQQVTACITPHLSVQVSPVTPAPLICPQGNQR